MRIGSPFGLPNPSATPARRVHVVLDHVGDAFLLAEGSWHVRGVGGGGPLGQWVAGLGCAQETHSSVQVEVVYVASSVLHTYTQMISIGAKKAAMQQDGSAPQGLQAPCDGHAQAVD